MKTKKIEKIKCDVCGKVFESMVQIVDHLLESAKCLKGKNTKAKTVNKKAK